MGGTRDVSLQLGRECGQVQVEVPGRPQHGRGPCELALGVDQFLRCQQLTAAVALVALCILAEQQLLRKAGQVAVKAPARGAWHMACAVWHGLS